MAAQNRQSQFHWHLSFLLLVTLAIPTGAQDIAPSGYTPFAGDKFFVLADSNFSSEDTATVRLEGPSGGQEGQEEYSGADIVVYRVPNPIDFLKRQKNLHRIKLKGDYVGEGLSNALHYVWDSWYKKSRLAWQRIFSADTRTKVITAVPDLKQAPPHSYRTAFAHNPQFKPLAGFTLMARFRYPIWEAKPITPPTDVVLAGSSSDFIKPRKGNVQIPLGRLTPGLYIVEAYIGAHHATTPVFVSDTVAVTKTSGAQLFVWTTHKKTGVPRRGATVLVTDGTGTLHSGTTDDDGVLEVTKTSPERSYVIGSDADGGVFVSENYYYDSEIYAAKLYAFTDRPLYRPGDQVRFKLVGRVFADARHALPLQAGNVRLAVTDSNGTPITTTDFALAPDEGGDGAFQLPESAAAGGYTLHLAYQKAVYSGSFRVAKYTKPHYDIDITLSQRGFKTGEPVTGKVRLTYPSGLPVKGATVELAVRAQPLTMVENEMRYRGQFPVKLQQNALAVAEDATAEFTVPAAQDPSRYVLTVTSLDGTSYRVTASKEVVIQASTPLYALSTASQLSKPSEEVAFTLRPLGTISANPAAWEATRLEDQRKFSGAVQGERFTIRFEQSGSYVVSVQDKNGHTVGSTPHWVAGPEIKTASGSITIVLDKDEYQAGETARAFITFPAVVQNALLTLERDRVEAYGLLSTPRPWLRLTQYNERQWLAEIPVKEEYSPNVTFSVLHVMDGAYVFHNKGIKVTVPRIRIAFTPDKATYLPGEQVQVDVKTTLGGKPVAANLTVSVVDAVVYTLQPEVAPDIGDFFYHVRRNQVKTASSLNFHTYDMAIPPPNTPPPQPSYSQRPLKMLERPRRENMDTAAWFPTLKTDANGTTRFTFTMPDALSRWRITGRAIMSTGSVGQSTAEISSAKDYYLKWTGPTVFRQGDEPVISLVGFNLSVEPRSAIFTAEGLGLHVRQDITLQPGANYLSFPLAARQGGAIVTQLAIQGQPVDRLETGVSVLPQGWLSTRTLPITLRDQAHDVPLPSGATNIRLSLAGNATDSFLRVADSLIEYPYGCVEQTASRLLPLALAYQHIKALALSENTLVKLRNQLGNSRLRLVQMAGPKSTFGWWGDLTAASPFLTTYAYYADWQALRALGVEAAPEHWQRLLEVYKNGADKESLLHKAIMLWLATDMGLPTRTLVQGVVAQAVRTTLAVEAPGHRGLEISWILDTDEQRESADLALVLLSLLADPGTADPAFWKRAEQARNRLAARQIPMAQALVLLALVKAGKAPLDPTRAGEVLAAVSPEVPTIDRALTLALINKAMRLQAPASPVSVAPGQGWQQRESSLGVPVWSWQGKAGENVRIALSETPHPPLRASLSYDSYGAEQGTLPITMARRLYRLQPRQDSFASEDGKAFEIVFDAQPVDPTAKLSAAALYLDEVALSTNSEKAVYRYGVVELPLPPGAAVDPTTSGMGITGLDGQSEPQELPQMLRNPSESAYAIPVDDLRGRQVFRHLVRFSQRGVFTLPSGRYFRMYQPSDKAFESAEQARQVEVE